MDSILYKRYHIDTKPVPNISPHPHRFNVRINKLNLFRLIFSELFSYRGNWKVVKSSPCVYGVFSGPVGGFSPREQLCVGCLRCTTEYPNIAQIYKNPARTELGDSYFTADQYETVVYEARTGMVPVKGAGYRGKFGGDGWDGMWTDMSEIVRPTRDGIHGREFISTEVDVGGAPPFLEFDLSGLVLNAPQNLTLPVPILFDAPPEMTKSTLVRSLSSAAGELSTLAFFPIEKIISSGLEGQRVVPVVSPEKSSQMKQLPHEPFLIEMQSWNEALFAEIKRLFPNTLISLKLQDDHNPLLYYHKGIRIFHLSTNYHGRGRGGKFIMEFIKETHDAFVEAEARDQVTLIGSGGIVAAEHLPKAIICGLDLVALNTPLLAALQFKFISRTADEKGGIFEMPHGFHEEWAVMRLKNLVNSWRDQLLEILGAMGLREVRRLRGERGRAMFQKDCENDAFSGIAGYERQ